MKIINKLIRKIKILTVLLFKHIMQSRLLNVVREGDICIKSFLSLLLSTLHALINNELHVMLFVSGICMSY